MNESFIKQKKELAEAWKNNQVVKDDRIIDAFLSIPRENFVPKKLRKFAYLDQPLPLGYGQTISQPTTIVIMIDALNLKKDDVVLEVGGGSGYCAALISKLAKHVYITEIIPELANFARQNLKKLGIENVTVIEADGSQGCELYAPYDKIIVSAACPKIPTPLINQLKENGIIVAPVEAGFGQKLLRGIKKGDKLIIESLGDFVFVPLRGKYGYN